MKHLDDSFFPPRSMHRGRRARAPLTGWLDRLLAYSAELSVPNPAVTLLASCRRAALDEVLDEFGPRAQDLSADLLAAVPAAQRELAGLAEAGLAQLRQRTLVHAERRSRAHASLARADHWWAATDRGEHIDDPTLDPDLRRRAMTNLDRVNELLDGYRGFFEVLGPAASSTARGDRPLRILELAAGHGGFSLALARLARARGLELEITATDLKAEYLELARGRAAREGLAIRYEVRDALDLGDIEPGTYDIVTCTQALHHFEPGALAIMMAEASRVAGRELVLIDGARSIIHAPVLYAYLHGQLGDPIIAHDAWVSCRRFLMPEELLLLARLGPLGAHASARWVAPSHCVLRIDTRDHQA